MKSDIKWHYPWDKDFDDLLMKYKNAEILVETNVTKRISNTKYFEWMTGRLSDVNESILRYAFIDEIKT